MLEPMDLSSDNMRALWREAGSVSVAARPRPSLTGPDRVLVDVVRAGLCRTDLYVARGELPGAASRLVLGHELAGRVRAVGAAVTTLAPGDPVAVDPRLRCARCEDCAAGRRCDRGGMIGVQRDGAFCETLELAAARALRLPPGLGF